MWPTPWLGGSGQAIQVGPTAISRDEGLANNSQEYPFEVFPPDVRESIGEACRNINAPASLVGSVFLGGMSLASQGLFDVSPAYGRKTPCNCFVIALADSGVGKTAVCESVFAPFREFEERVDCAYRQALPEYNRQQKLWNSLEQSFRKAIEKKKLKGECCDEEMQRWEEHAKDEPKPPKSIRFIYDDATQRAVKAGLNENGKSSGIISSAGGGVLTGPAFTTLFIYNQLWSGETIRSDRISTDSFVISGARCTILLCVQPGVFGKFLAGRGEDARENGFLARTFVVLAKAVPRPAGADVTGNSWEHLPKFQARVTSLLEQQYPGLGQQEPPERECLGFTPEAELRWRRFENRVKADMNPGGVFADFQDMAAKLPDNVARVAALFHVFDGKTGPIPEETVARAEKLCCWYADEFMGVFAGGQETVQEEADAVLLESWLSNELVNKAIGRLPKNQILQRGPNVLRNKARLDPALASLCDTGRIRIITEGKTRFVYLWSTPIFQGNYGCEGGANQWGANSHSSF